MVQNVFEHEGAKVIDWIAFDVLLCWVFAFAFGLVEDEIEELEVFVLAVGLVLEQFVDALLVELFAFVDDEMEKRDHVGAELEGTVVS